MKYIYLAGFVDIDGWGDITLSGVRSAVDSARAENPSEDITLVLNSPGGDVMEGLAIYNYLKRTKVNVEISGMAASIASVIALAGQHVAIYDNSSLFIHHAWSYVGDANADEARTAADRMEAIDAMIQTVYEARGLSEEKIREIMDGPDGQGTLINASDALTLGLVDEILDPALALAACIRNRNSHPHTNPAGAKPGETKESAQMKAEDPNLTEPNAATRDDPAAADPEQDPEETPDTEETQDTADDSAASVADEVKALKAQVEALAQQVAAKDAEIAEKDAKLAAQKKFRAVVASAREETAAAANLTFPEAVAKHGFAAACEKFPTLRANYMRAEMRKGSIR